MKTSKIRLFKPGDRVQRKSGGPVMIVQKYAREYSILLGWHESNHSVECSLLGPDGFHKEIINQNNLKRAPSNYRMGKRTTKPTINNKLGSLREHSRKLSE